MRWRLTTARKGIRDVVSSIPNRLLSAIEVRGAVGLSVVCGSASAVAHLLGGGFILGRLDGPEDFVGCARDVLPSDLGV